jgi:hypothetical protein
MERTAVRGRLTWQVATVATLTWETASMCTIELEPPDWPGHRAGQHLDVRLTAADGNTAERSYSIASAPSELLAVTVERLDDGEVSPYLTEELRAGDEAVGPVADLRGPGTVVRCRNCSGVLMVISQIRAMNRVDLHGLAALDPRQGGWPYQVALLLAQAAPHPVSLMCPQRKRQAFTPDPAPCANSLRLRLLCHGQPG